jgi:iron complex transport system substrate-binding protein
VSPFGAVPGIVDASNRAWPRRVRSGDAIVEIKAKPERVHTLSLGLDETAYSLVPASRVVAVGRATTEEGQSNVAHLTKGAVVVARDAEQIIAQRPDIVLASPSSSAALVTTLQNGGVTVVRVGQDNTPENRVQSILLMGYILGEEDRAVRLAAEVKERVKALEALAATKPDAARPKVLSLTYFTDKVYTAGKGSTEGAIILAAGGRNVAAEAGLERNPTTSFEGVIAMAPEIIFIPQPLTSGEPFRESLLKNEALREVPAIKSGRVYAVEPKLFTTLSFYNVRGSEELAKLLWPEWSTKTFPPFSLP